MNLAIYLPRIMSRVLFVFSLSLIVTGAVFAASGDLDQSFNATAQLYTNGKVYAMRLQADGKILVGGDFTVLNGVARAGIARLNADRSLDTSFVPPNFYNDTGIGRLVRGIGIQSDGKIIVVGKLFGVLGGSARAGAQRLNPDGSLDGTFFAPSDSGTIADVEIQADDKILIVGSGVGITRLNPAGTIDNSFTNNIVTTVNDIRIQPDGKILAGGQQFLVRLDTAGQPDPTLSVTIPSNAAVQSIDLQQDGKIVIVGSFTTVNGVAVSRIARLLSDGSIDNTFNTTGSANAINRVAVTFSGQILVLGQFGTYQNKSRPNIARLNSDGALDLAFTPNIGYSGSTPTELSLLSLPSGEVLAGLPEYLVALNINGQYIANGQFSIGRDALVRKIIEQPDGKVLAAGDFDQADGEAAAGVARYNANGTLDSSFTSTYNSLHGGELGPTAMALQPDGKILIKHNSKNLFRTNPDGTYDVTFNGSPINSSAHVYDMTVLTDGKIMIVGDTLNGSSRIVRLNADGSIDVTFAPQQPNNTVRAVYVQSDGKMVIGGDFTSIPNVPFATIIRNRVARLLANGSVDTTFVPPVLNSTVLGLDVQSDGKVLVGGQFSTVDGNGGYKFISRLNSDGSLDGSYAPAIDWVVHVVKIQTSGKVLIGGTSVSNVGGLVRQGIERLNTNGSIDGSFSIGSGANDNVYSIALRSTGRILVGGRFSQFDGVSHPTIVGLLDASRSRPFDFDGDGRSDVSVFRPSGGDWYLNNSQTGFAAYHFGASGDMPTPADFTGDGKADLAVFRPSNGTWYVLRSEDLTFYSVGFGISGDLPVTADYDGDGKADVAVYRPSAGTWYLQQSTAGFSAINFGIAEDKPTVGDFDGDGKNDIAIYRPSTGFWYRINSSDGSFASAAFGSPGDIPVVMDYDGDGKANLTVFRPSEGTWYIARPTGVPAQNYDAVRFGANGDMPVPADYDGDGKADIAVFRPSDGNWYLQQSTSGFSSVHFGTSGDKPTPSAFVY